MVRFKEIVKFINSLNLDSNDNVLQLKQTVYDIMDNFINKNEQLTDEDVYTFVFLMQKLIMHDKGMDLDVDGYQDKESNIIMSNIPSYSSKQKEKNVIYTNFASQIFDNFRTKNYSRIERILCLNKLIFCVEHELRHEWQLNYISNTKNYNATTLIIADEITKFNKMQRFYKNNHDKFLIEKDADYSAYVNAPITLKKYFPFLTETECNILDLNNTKKSALKFSIKSHKNTVWQILSDNVNTINALMESKKINLLGGILEIESKSDDLNSLMKRSQIKYLLKKMPILKFIYKSSGEKKDEKRILYDYNFLREKLMTNKLSVTQDSEADLLRFNVAYFNLLNVKNADLELLDNKYENK